MKKIYFICILNLSCAFNVLKAQNLIFKEATLAHPAEMWKPFNLNNGTNLKDGVSFYVYNTDCNGTKIKLMKVINTNNYAVNFSYQLTKDAPVVNVHLPALLTIEGSCNTTDENLKKLTLDLTSNKPKTKDVSAKDFFINHIVLSKIE